MILIGRQGGKRFLFADYFSGLLRAIALGEYWGSKPTEPAIGGAKAVLYLEKVPSVQDAQRVPELIQAANDFPERTDLKEIISSITTAQQE